MVMVNDQLIKSDQMAKIKKIILEMIQSRSDSQFKSNFKSKSRYKLQYQVESGSGAEAGFGSGSETEPETEPEAGSESGSGSGSDDQSEVITQDKTKIQTNSNSSSNSNIEFHSLYQTKLKSQTNENVQGEFLKQEIRQNYPDICIVLATYNPNENFFAQQIESIKNQTYQNWFALISDDNSSDSVKNFIRKYCSLDPRFIFLNDLIDEKDTKQLGSIKNFERGLSFVPSFVELISLCDQDDVWHSDKLDKMKSQFDLYKNVMMLHSDLRLIDASNKIIKSSCWESEKRNVTSFDLNTLLFRNSVTGCACMFRKKILDFALPFPDFKNSENDFSENSENSENSESSESSDEFRISLNDKEKSINLLFNKLLPVSKIPFHHDQWLSVCSLIYGDIKALNVPLIDYRQHGANVVGAQQLSLNIFKDVFKFSKNLKSFLFKCIQLYQDRVLLSLSFYKRLCCIELKTDHYINNIINLENNKLESNRHDSSRDEFSNLNNFNIKNPNMDNITFDQISDSRLKVDSSNFDRIQSGGSQIDIVQLGKSQLSQNQFDQKRYDLLKKSICEINNYFGFLEIRKLQLNYVSLRLYFSLFIGKLLCRMYNLKKDL